MNSIDFIGLTDGRQSRRLILATVLISAAVLLGLIAPASARADDRTTYDEGSRPRVLINWDSFEDAGFPPHWQTPFLNVVINSYTRLNRVGAIDVRPQFHGWTTRTDSEPGEIVISANEKHADSSRLASTFGFFPDRLKIVFHRKRGADLTLWNWTPYWPNPGEYSMQAVMMHEFGHALGLDHAAGSKNIMGSYDWRSHHGPWSGDLADLRALYRLREQNRLRQLASYDGGAGWGTLSADLTAFPKPARSTNKVAVTGNTSTAGYLVGWTTPDNRLSWAGGDGVSFPASRWQIYTSHPRPRYGSALASDNADATLWAVVDGRSDDNRVRVIRSRDDGASWSYTGFPEARTSSTPGIAFVRVDGREAWVVAWINYDEDERENTGFIHASVSFDEGASWSEPHAVDSFYRVHDGVSLGATPEGTLRVHFVWAGEKGIWEYGQNKLRSFTAEVSGSGVVSRGSTLCTGNTHSRIAPDLAFHASTAQFVEGLREQDFNTSMNSRSFDPSGCPGGALHIPSSTAHAAPGVADNAAWHVPGVGTEVVLWRVSE